MHVLNPTPCNRRTTQLQAKEKLVTWSYLVRKLRLLLVLFLLILNFQILHWGRGAPGGRWLMKRVALLSKMQQGPWGTVANAGVGVKPQKIKIFGLIM